MTARRGTVAVLAVLLAASLAGCGGAEPEPTPQVPQVQTYEVGEPSEAGEWGLTTKLVERLPQAGGATAEPGQELLVITFELNNGSSSDQGIGPSSFILNGPDGNVYQAAQTSDPEFIFNTAQPIKAGETRVIKIAYGVPVGTTPFQWSFAPFTENGSSTPAIMTID